MEQTVQKQRVAVYCRVFAGSEDHPASLAAQEAYYTEMVGQRPDWDLAGIYADRGITGTGRQNRKEFKKMLTACQKGKIDIILVKSISRFSRNSVKESTRTGLGKRVQKPSPAKGRNFRGQKVNYLKQGKAN